MIKRISDVFQKNMKLWKLKLFLQVFVLSLRTFQWIHCGFQCVCFLAPPPPKKKIHYIALLLHPAISIITDHNSVKGGLKVNYYIVLNAKYQCPNNTFAAQVANEIYLAMIAHAME